VALVTTVGLAGTAHAASPFLEVPPEEEVEVTPAYRYANMTDAEAYAELDRRQIPYRRESAAPGVRAPIRLTGRLHEVWIHSSLAPEERAGSVFEILDARLALALDDFAVILARHDVVEVVHYTMYRPNVPSPEEVKQAAKAAEKAKQNDEKAKTSARAKGKRRASLDGKAVKGPKTTRKPAGSARRKEIDLPAFDDAAPIAPALGKPKQKPAPKTAAPPKAPPPAKKRGEASKSKSAKKVIAGAHDHGKWAPPGTRHPAGLAIDVGVLKKRDGSQLHVAAHFRGKVGARTCGDGAPEADTVQGRELRAIVCEAREAGVFTYALTPNFDAPHADHFHLEIKPGVKWFLYH
jgi:hypothetical protein